MFELWLNQISNLSIAQSFALIMLTCGLLVMVYIYSKELD